MLKKSRLLGYIALVLIPFFGMAQYDHVPVFTDLEGQELLVSVVDTYKPGIILTYGQARDTMFSKIDAVNDSLECAYTGMKLYLPPNEDPTQAVYLDGIDNGINTEHSYPQSKGASEGNARSDMHHLYPTRSKTNNDRGSMIFKESNDAQTNIWYLKSSEQSNIPTSNIEAYSELGSDGFEPRESMKGDVARSLMYFYTMYRDQANAADPAYFGLQQETLCDWHYADPVDQKEWERSQKIALWQEGKANPFVLDCSLAARLYCSEVSPECMAVDTKENQLQSINIYPNPSTDFIFIEGIEVERISIANVSGNTKSYLIDNGKVDISELSSGIYFIAIHYGDKRYTQTFVKY